MKVFLISASLIVTFAFGISSGAQAETKAPSTPAPSAKAKVVDEEVQIVEGVECVHDKDVRRIEVHTREAGCSLQYFKFGKNNELAEAKRGVEVCKSGLNKIRHTLEASGYKCK